MTDSEPEQGEIGERLIRPLCQQCRKNEFKYKCPECAIKTCSLNCVNAHKQATGCRGKKRVHGFVKMSDFTLTHLWRDYSFINERMNQTHSFKRKYMTQFQNTHRSQLKKLRSVCRIRGGFRFHMAPSFSKLHTMNNSYFEYQESLIYWSVLLIVRKGQISTEKERWLFISRPLSEKRVLVDILKEYILKKTKFYSVSMNQYLSDINLDHITKGSLYLKAKKLEKKVQEIEETKRENEEEQEKEEGETKNQKRNFAISDFGNLKLHSVGLQQSIEESIQGSIVNEFPVYLLAVE